MFLGTRGAVLVGTMLALQLIVLFFSLGPAIEVSAFCAGPAASPIAVIFSGLHLLFLALLVVGASSLRFAGLRLPYAALLLVALCALPIQARLVSSGQLQCDGP